MNILEEIIQAKKAEVERSRQLVPIDTLVQEPLFESETRSLSESIKAGSGIIAEFKRKSPSAGSIQNQELEDVMKFYDSYGVSGCSILTDAERFGGSTDDLKLASSYISAPVLRKEFIIDEYQLFESKAFGADAILLIAEALDEYHATHLATIAQSIGLEVLMELHSEEELDKLNDAVDIIGVNNRNLKTLETDLYTSEKLIRYLPYEKVRITESGIRNADQLSNLYAKGFDGCLVGESILKNQSLLADLSNAARSAKSVSNEA